MSLLLLPIKFQRNRRCCIRLCLWFRFTHPVCVQVLLHPRRQRDAAPQRAVCHRGLDCVARREQGVCEHRVCEHHRKLSTRDFLSHKVLQPAAGQVLVVSGGAGAVGSLVGQLAKLKGAKVIGIAGSAAKCKLMKDEVRKSPPLPLFLFPLTHCIHPICSSVSILPSTTKLTT